MTAPTPIADMITEMLKNCIPLEMIIVAVRSMERAVSTRQGVDETAEKRRAWDRDYRRKRREHPPDPPDIHPITPDVGNNALSSLKEDKKHSEVVSKKEKKERGSKCPPDWKPNQHHYEEGAKLGMSASDVDERAARMRLWCEANANRSVTTKANWDATFTGTWLKDSRNGNHATGTIRTNQAAGPAQTRDTAVIAGMGRALARRREARAADDPGREEFRERGSAGPAAGDDPERGSKASDDGTSRQLTLVPGGYPRQ